MMTVFPMRPPVALSTFIGKFGQFLHILFPLTVKSNISDVILRPFEFHPVATRNLETAIQKEEKIAKILSSFENRMKKKGLQDVLTAIV